MRRLLTLLLALCLFAAACGGGGGDGGEAVVVDDQRTPAELAALLTSASEETRSAGSSKVYYEASMPGVGTMAGTGEFDYDDELGRLSFDFSDLAVAMGAPVGTDVTAEMISTGLVIYMRMPFLTQVLGHADRWIRMDLGEMTADQGGVDLSQLSQLGGGGDPTQALAFFEGVSDSVTELGLEEITLGAGAGPTVDATRYHATVDLRRAYEEAGAIVDPAQFEAFIDQMGTDELDVDAWIDDGGRMVRVAYAVPIPDGTGATQPMEMVMDLFDFGVDVDVAEPDPAQVVDLADLAGALPPG